LEKENSLTFITRVFQQFSELNSSILASNLAQPKRSSRSKHDAGTFRGRNSTKNHSKRFKPIAQVYISKIKDKRTSKGSKALQETKI
jgi:hypothetical protein